MQTLAYRAPEVVYGVPFGCAIDLWSLGVTLAELYAGRALLHAASRGGLAVELAQLLGRPPTSLFAHGRYAAELLPLVAHTAECLPIEQVRQRLSAELRAPSSSDAHQLIDLISRLLTYDPSARLDARAALAHPFLAPVFPFQPLLASGAPATLAAAPSEEGVGAPRVVPGRPTSMPTATPPALSAATSPALAVASFDTKPAAMRGTNQQNAPIAAAQDAASCAGTLSSEAALPQGKRHVAKRRLDEGHVNGLAGAAPSVTDCGGAAFDDVSVIADGTRDPFPRRSRPAPGSMADWPSRPKKGLS